MQQRASLPQSKREFWVNFSHACPQLRCMRESCVHFAYLRQDREYLLTHLLALDIKPNATSIRITDCCQKRTYRCGEDAAHPWEIEVLASGYIAGP